MKSPITADSGAMLNAYPDSMGGTLADIAALLARPELRGAFTSFYILPSLFHTDLDRGFSVIDYSLNQLLAAPEDLDALREQGIDLKPVSYTHLNDDAFPVRGGLPVFEHLEPRQNVRRKTARLSLDSRRWHGGRFRRGVRM